MKHFTALAASAALALISSNAAATIINLDGPDDNGVVVNLGPGTYDVAVVGIAGGGAYDAWNAWSSVSGCDTQGQNCATGFLVSYAVDLGAGGVFNQTNGYRVQPVGPAIFSSAIAALTAFNSNPIVRCDFGAACSFPSGSMTSFTLAAAQDVNFLILDTPYFDNSGGVSLQLTQRAVGGIPEPTTWALLLGGFGMTGATLRRRRLITA